MNPSVLIVIQCRTGSSRLPAKGLLPLGGMPIAVLCAQRSGNSGMPVVIATSDHPSDDWLCKQLDMNGVKYVRGPLDDVLGRYLLATKLLSDEDVAVRLTADNVFPDGALIAEAVRQLIASGSEYLSISSAKIGLPYGLAVEAFRVGALRKNAEGALTEFEREHVTPKLRERARIGIFQSSATCPMGQLRCTIDTLDDYLRIAKVFEGVADPVAVSWSILCDRLCRLDSTCPPIPFRVRPDGRKISLLTVGSAQIGLDHYGRTRVGGAISVKQAVSMLAEAFENGVQQVDCARAYGRAESVVGCALKSLTAALPSIMTKLSPLSDLPASSTPHAVASAVEASILRSSRELGLSRLPIVLLHRWEHRHADSGIVWEKLLELREEGLIGELGASVYNTEDALAALADPEIRHLQIPFNILDRRWHTAGVPEAARARADVCVYARSVFLQGLLLNPVEYWPSNTGMDHKFASKQIDALVEELERQDRRDLCLAYVAAQEWVDSLVVGVDSIEQLRENLAAIRRPPLAPNQCRQVAERFPNASELLLNPSLWKN